MEILLGSERRACKVENQRLYDEKKKKKGKKKKKEKRNFNVP